LDERQAIRGDSDERQGTGDNWMRDKKLGMIG
jgi:hypothetical protein